MNAKLVVRKFSVLSVVWVAAIFSADRALSAEFNGEPFCSIQCYRMTYAAAGDDPKLKEELENLLSIRTVSKANLQIARDQYRNTVHRARMFEITADAAEAPQNIPGYDVFMGAKVPALTNPPAFTLQTTFLLLEGIGKGARVGQEMAIQIGLESYEKALQALGSGLDSIGLEVAQKQAIDNLILDLEREKKNVDEAPNDPGRLMRIRAIHSKLNELQRKLTPGQKEKVNEKLQGLPNRSPASAESIEAELEMADQMLGVAANAGALVDDLEKSQKSAGEAPEISPEDLAEILNDSSSWADSSATLFALMGNEDAAKYASRFGSAAKVGAIVVGVFSSPFSFGGVQQLIGAIGILDSAFGRGSQDNTAAIIGAVRDMVSGLSRQISVYHQQQMTVLAQMEENNALRHRQLIQLGRRVERTTLQNQQLIRSLTTGGAKFCLDLVPEDKYENRRLKTVSAIAQPIGFASFSDWGKFRRQMTRWRHSVRPCLEGLRTHFQPTIDGVSFDPSLLVVASTDFTGKAGDKPVDWQTRAHSLIDDNLKMLSLLTPEAIHGSTQFSYDLFRLRIFATRWGAGEKHFGNFRSSYYNDVLVSNSDELLDVSIIQVLSEYLLSTHTYWDFFGASYDLLHPSKVVGIGGSLEGKRQLEWAVVLLSTAIAQQSLTKSGIPLSVFAETLRVRNRKSSEVLSPCSGRVEDGWMRALKYDFGNCREHNDSAARAEFSNLVMRSAEIISEVLASGRHPDFPVNIVHYIVHSAWMGPLGVHRVPKDLLLYEQLRTGDLGHTTEHRLEHLADWIEPGGAFTLKVADEDILSAGVKKGHAYALIENIQIALPSADLVGSGSIAISDDVQKLVRLRSAMLNELSNYDLIDPDSPLSKQQKELVLTLISNSVR